MRAILKFTGSNFFWLTPACSAPFCLTLQRYEISVAVYEFSPNFFQIFFEVHSFNFCQG